MVATVGTLARLPNGTTVTVTFDSVTGVVSGVGWSGSAPFQLTVQQAGKQDIVVHETTVAGTLQVSPALGYVFPTACGIYVDGV